MFKIYTKPNCIQCTMTKNVVKALKANAKYIPINPGIVNTLKTKYHVKQMPFVQVIDQNQQVIDSWTGFQPDKIKHYA